MSIKFLCAHCKKVLSVKDQLAGKRGKCPHCGTVVLVPVPSKPAAPAAPRLAESPSAPPPPHADLDALAAAALADEPKADAPPAAPTTIDFECPMCGEELHLPLDLAGKRAPCPECRRIIKVPEPEKKDPANWRQATQNLPSAARRPEEKAPEGAWSSAAGAAMVSREALHDAGAIPEARAQLTVRQRVVRYTWVAGVVVFVVVCAVLGYLKWAEAVEAKALDAALSYAESAAGKGELGREGQAAVYRLAGDYFLRQREAGGAAKAREQFEKSLGLLRQPGGAERDALLQDLAHSELEMGGSPQEVDAGLRLKWDDVQKELHAALANMRSAEARMGSLRDLTRRLAEKGQGERAAALASSLYPSPNGDRAEALGAVGLELRAAGKNDLAEKAADQVLQMYAAEKGRPALAPSAVALAIAVGRQPPPPGKRGSKWEVDDKTSDRIGQAEGAARAGKWNDARQKVQDLQKDLPNAQLRVYVGLAAAALDDKSAGKAGVEEEMKGAMAARGTSPWLLLRLARVGERAGVAPDAVRTVAAVIADADLRGRAQLAALEAQLAQTKAAADPKLIDGVDAPALSSRLAREEWARHNIRYSSGTPGVVKGWDAPNKAFGLLGVALGSQGPE